MKILTLHGINLNMFGKRDPKQYGTTTLAEIDAQLAALGRELGAEVECYQTNIEGEMASRIHRAHGEQVDAVIITASGCGTTVTSNVTVTNGTATLFFTADVPLGVAVDAETPLASIPAGRCGAPAAHRPTTRAPRFWR